MIYLWFRLIAKEATNNFCPNIIAPTIHMKTILHKQVFHHIPFCIQHRHPFCSCWSLTNKFTTIQIHGLFLKLQVRRPATTIFLTNSN